jgi:FixJ family two-component response regulator
MSQITATESKRNRPEIAHAEVVCLVDDDRSVRESICRLLESDGFRVCAFSEPEAFLNHVATNSVQVAILDIWMETMTGMELLAHLCAKSPQTRVIFITGHEDAAAAATVMPAGPSAFLLKPLDADQLLSAVHRAFGRPSPGKNAERAKTQSAKP